VAIFNTRCLFTACLRSLPPPSLPPTDVTAHSFRGRNKKIDRRPETGQCASVTGTPTAVSYARLWPLSALMSTFVYLFLRSVYMSASKYLPRRMYILCSGTLVYPSISFPRSVISLNFICLTFRM
jgi:hypothetical protein